MTASGERNPKGSFTEMNLLDSISAPDPKRPSRFPDSCRSTNPEFFELEFSEADVADLTLPAITGRWLLRLDFHVERRQTTALR